MRTIKSTSRRLLAITLLATAGLGGSVYASEVVAQRADVRSILPSWFEIPNGYAVDVHRDPPRFAFAKTQ